MKFFCKTFFMKLFSYRLFSFILILILINSNNILQTQPVLIDFLKNKSNNKYKFDVNLEANIIAASTRYNKNGTEILKDNWIHIWEDSSTIDTFQLSYTTNFNAQSYNLSFGYNGIKNCWIYASIPFIYYKVVEKFNYDTSELSRFEKNNNSKFIIDGLNLDAGYTFNFDNFNFNFFGGIFIPLYKYENWIDTTKELFHNKNIQFGKVFNSKIGTSLDLNLKPIHLCLGGFYRLYNEYVSDNIIVNFLIGLSSVENTDFFIKLNYCHPLKNYDNVYEVTFWREILWNKYLDFIIGFKMLFSDEFYLDAGYDLRVWGNNTIARRSVNIKLGYLF